MFDWRPFTQEALALTKLCRPKLATLVIDELEIEMQKRKLSKPDLNSIREKLKLVSLVQKNPSKKGAQNETDKARWKVKSKKMISPKAFDALTIKMEDQCL